jgi:hypothetical protein
VIDYVSLIHILIRILGTATTMSLLVYVGYVERAVTIPNADSDGGLNALQAPGPFVELISAAILVLVAGVLAGGIGFLFEMMTLSSIIA